MQPYSGIYVENRITAAKSSKQHMKTNSNSNLMKTISQAVKCMIAVFTILLSSNSFGQMAPELNRSIPGAENTAKMNIYNYTTAYNSGKVFVSWTSKNESADCLYIVERSNDGSNFESVGIKEGIGSEIELYYSWIDKTPPAGFAYYRVKKITRDGSQLYSAVNSVINQATNFENYAMGEGKAK